MRRRIPIAPLPSPPAPSPLQIAEPVPRGGGEAGRRGDGRRRRAAHRRGDPPGHPAGVQPARGRAGLLAGGLLHVAARVEGAAEPGAAPGPLHRGGVRGDVRQHRLGARGRVHGAPRVGPLLPPHAAVRRARAGEGRGAPRVRAPPLVLHPGAPPRLARGDLLRPAPRAPLPPLQRRAPLQEHLPGVVRHRRRRRHVRGDGPQHLRGVRPGGLPRVPPRALQRPERPPRPPEQAPPEGHPPAHLLPRLGARRAPRARRPAPSQAPQPQQRSRRARLSKAALCLPAPRLQDTSPVVRLGIGVPVSAGARRVLERPEALMEKAKVAARVHRALVPPEEGGISRKNREVRLRRWTPSLSPGHHIPRCVECFD